MSQDLIFAALSLAFVAAEASLPSAGEALQMIGALGGTGFAVWYAYHTTTKTIPDLNATHAATVKDLNTTHAAAIQKLTADFASAIEKVQKEAREETRADRHLYRNESHVRHLEIQALTVAVEELVAKLGHPGALRIETPKVVLKTPGDADSDPDMDAVDDGRK